MRELKVMNWFRASGWYSSGSAITHGKRTPQKKEKPWLNPFSNMLYLITMLKTCPRSHRSGMSCGVCKKRQVAAWALPAKPCTGMLESTATTGKT